MSDKLDKSSLDNYITGNYGNDQSLEDDASNDCPSCGESLEENDLSEEVCVNDECSEFGKNPFVKNAQDLNEDFTEEEFELEDKDDYEEET